MIRLLYTFFVVALFIKSILAQNNTITLGGIATHFINNEKYDLVGPAPGYYNYPVSPGLEILFSKKLLEKTKIETGLNFQRGQVASYISGLRRFTFYDLSIPLLIKKDFILNEEKQLFTTTGIYGGKTFLQKAENPTKYDGWVEFFDRKYLENYSDDKLFLDIYFDVGYSQSITKLGIVSFAPFIKYRVNTTWLNYHQKKIHYGIKVYYKCRL